MGESRAQLRQFIQEHQVIWSTQVLTAIREGERVEVGFELEFLAIHGPAFENPEPDCPACHLLFAGLKQLAEEILPKEHRPTRYEIEPFDHSFRLGPLPELQPRVALKLQLLHRQGYFNPVDDCETRCLKEIETSLRELGAQKGKWRRRRSHNQE